MYDQLQVLERHCRDYDAWFSAVDTELYRLFREHPLHGDVRENYAKITILNRVYMTGLERSSSAADPGATIATLLSTHASSLDTRIAALRTLVAPDREALARVAAMHGWLVCEVLADAGVGAPISFASKYLHFHAPTVPIYDGLACRALGDYARRRFGRYVATDARLPRLEGQLQSYRWLCARFAELWEDVQESRAGTTVKELDHHLWQLGAGR